MDALQKKLVRNKPLAQLKKRFQDKKRLRLLAIQAKQEKKKKT